MGMVFTCQSHSQDGGARVEVVGLISSFANLRLRLGEVRAAASALRATGDLRKQPFTPWDPNNDLLDWLGLMFGFQNDNVKNQRENPVLHLANSQMRVQPPPTLLDSLEAGVLCRFRRKLRQNYTSWCSYLGRKSQISVSHRRNGTGNSETNSLHYKLLYVSLYLLI
ncbi:hypothetical protein SO802_025850 [Lithocarpus litseifolius]|uniref:Uncharacterized protein n=1 Tax=Lithocarpus litseifolius TaxID=425828 RepID=A0AAW2C1C1_9ROSI